MTVPIWSFNSPLNRKYSFSSAGWHERSCLHSRPKPLFYKWKPQRQLSLRWFTVWPRARSQKPPLPPRALVLFARMWLFTVKEEQTNKHKQTEKKRPNVWTTRGVELTAAQDTAESFQSCHSGESQRPDNAHKWRISGQPWKHMCRKVKEVEQRRKFGTCSSCVVVGTTGLFDLLYSGVTGLWQTASPAQAEGCEAARLRGCEAARLDGPIWSRWEREKGHLPWSKEQLNKVLKHFPKNFRGAQTWSARITKSFLEGFFGVFFFFCTPDGSNWSNKDNFEGEF